MTVAQGILSAVSIPVFLYLGMDMFRPKCWGLPPISTS
jgi:hypothetical protein